jgi:hypothetical protein
LLLYLEIHNAQRWFTPTLSPQQQQTSLLSPTNHSVSLYKHI